jgi:hypothetical protein
MERYQKLTTECQHALDPLVGKLRERLSSPETRSEGSIGGCILVRLSTNDALCGLEPRQGYRDCPDLALRGDVDGLPVAARDQGKIGGEAGGIDSYRDPAAGRAPFETAAYSARAFGPGTGNPASRAGHIAAEFELVAVARAAQRLLQVRVGRTVARTTAQSFLRAVDIDMVPPPDQEPANPAKGPDSAKEAVGTHSSAETRANFTCFEEKVMAA